MLISTTAKKTHVVLEPAVTYDIDQYYSNFPKYCPLDVTVAFTSTGTAPASPLPASYIEVVTKNITQAQDSWRSTEHLEADWEVLTSSLQIDKLEANEHDTFAYTVTITAAIRGGDTSAKPDASKESEFELTVEPNCYLEKINLIDANIVNSLEIYVGETDGAKKDDTNYIGD
jgi:hypothetical protein